jgi:hypothetical protein
MLVMGTGMARLEGDKKSRGKQDDKETGAKEKGDF